MNKYYGCISAIKYHPILGIIYNLVHELKEKYENDSEKIRAELKTQKIKVPELGIMISRARIQDKIDYYTALLKEPPTRLAEMFLEKSVLWGKESWGLLLKAPYFREAQFTDKHDYCLMMIRPGVEKFEIDDFNQEYLDKIKDLVNYIDVSKASGHHDTKNSNIFSFIHGSWNLRSIANYIITVPHSLDDDSIRTLTDYTFESAQIIYVCQTEEVARRTRKIIAEMNIENMEDNDNPLARANVVVDPNYYSSFVVSSPKVDELWEKYKTMIKKPYGMDFSRRIKYLYAFCYNLSVAGVESGKIIVDTRYLYNVFNEIAFGGYQNDRIYLQELRNFIKVLKELNQKYDYYRDPLAMFRNDREIYRELFYDDDEFGDYSY